MKTFQEVQALLSVPEPDEKIYAQISAQDIPVLQSLLDHAQNWISARAILALSRIAHEDAYGSIRTAVQSTRLEVRLAIALALPFLPSGFAAEILHRLLDDENAKIKQLAIYSIPDRPSKAIRNRLRDMSLKDPLDNIKSLSREKLSILQ